MENNQVATWIQENESWQHFMHRVVTRENNNTRKGDQAKVEEKE